MYQELIDADVREVNDARQAERGSDTGEWHPSGLVDCARKAVYSYTGTPPSDVKDMRSIRIMNQGTNIHEWVQALVTVAEPDFLPEVKVDHAGLKGSCDGLLPVGDGFYEVQEYKSISPNALRYMKGAKPEHIKQARIYHRCLRAMGYLLTDTIRIVYVNRDDHSVTEYEVDAWLDVEWYEFLAEIADLEDHVHEGTLPDRMPLDPKGKKYWLCNYCEFATRCWEEDD